MLLSKKLPVIVTLIALLISGPTLAGFDGFNVLSSTFDNQFNGDQINDGVGDPGDVGDWMIAGGLDASDISISNTDNLSVLQAANNGWFQQDNGTSPWEMGSGSWTVEVRAHLMATGTTGLNIWGALNGERHIMVLNEASTTDLGGTVFDSTDNTDGFHDFRLVYDSTDDVYHYFRDAVQITPPGGLPQQAATGSTRLIIGDCCTSVGGMGNQYEIDYVRFDMTGAFSPAADQGTVALTIDRSTGQVQLSNTTGTSVDNIIGYSITSDAGSLDAGPWNQFSSSSPLASDNDTWTTLTPSGGDELAEAVLNTPGDGDGGNLNASSSADFGNVWKKSPFEDLEIELLLDDGSSLSSIAGDFGVEYTGDAVVAGDIAGGTVNDGPNGIIDVIDWIKFKAGVGTDVSTLSQADAYLSGDLTGDLAVNSSDFITFVAAFDAANGAGSFAALTATPEPSSGLLLLAGAGFTYGIRRRKRLTSKTQLELASTECSSESATMTKAKVSVAIFGISLVFGISSLTHAQVLDSSTFAHQYNGNDIYLDGAPPGTGAGTFSPDWNQAGGGDVVATDLTNNGANLVYTPTSNNGWHEQDGGGTPWETAGSGVVFQLGWTFEMSVDLNDISAANDNIVMWNEGGGNRQIIVIEANQVTTFDGTVLDTNDNTDGQHVFQLQFNSTDTTADPSGTYQLYRDGVQIGTDLARQSAQGVSRLIIGDCCTSLGNPIDQYEIGYVRFDSVLPTPDSTLTLEVDTITGAVSLVNNSSVSVDFNGYFIESASGQLAPGTWSSLQDNPSFGNGDDDDGIDWESFDTQTAGFLGEGNLTDGAGNTGFSTLASGASISLGTAYNPAIAGAGLDGDLLFTLTDQNGGTISSNVFGTVEYVTGVAVDGDYNGNGVVDASDYAVWRESLGQTGAGLAADGNGDNVVNTADYTYWKERFGNTSNGSGQATATPEPAAGLLAIAAAMGLGGLRRSRNRRVNSASPLPASQGGPAMSSAKPLFTTMFTLALAASASVAMADVTNDRVYSFGDDGFENGSPGAALGTDFGGTRLTFDSEVSDTASPLSDAQDLTVTGGTYIAVDGTDGGGLPARPGAANGSVGANLDGDDSLTTIPFNSPDEYWDAADTMAWVDPPESYPRNYDGIFSRGIEFWAYPDSANDDGAQHVLIRDSDEHGVVITANGTWGNAFDNAIRDSGVAVAFDQWNHVQVVSRSGALGSTLYIDGIAVEANTPFYDPERAVQLVIGSNFAADDEFYTGVIDDMNIFLWGDNEMGSPGTLTDGEDWGTFNLGEDNVIVAEFLSNAGVTDDADVNLDGAITVADASAFVGFYGFEQLVTGVTAGDIVSRQNGDLNYDGVTNLADAFILHEALEAAGIPISVGQLIGGVPEPTSAALLLVATFAVGGSRRRMG